MFDKLFRKDVTDDDLSFAVDMAEFNEEGVGFSLQQKCPLVKGVGKEMDYNAYYKLVHSDTNALITMVKRKTWQIESNFQTQWRRKRIFW